MALNILVVDDANEFADLIVMDLISRKFSARAQYSGLSAITSALTLQFNVILLDIMMPGDITLRELLQIQRLDYYNTLIPLTDDIFFIESQSNIPINDIISANMMDIQAVLQKDESSNISLFQPLHVIEEMQNILFSMGELFIHLDGYVTSAIIKSTLKDFEELKILFFTAGGVDDAYYRKYSRFFADNLFLKSNYYDKVLKELEDIEKSGSKDSK